MAEASNFIIASPRTYGDLMEAVGLLQAYAASLDIDLRYQGFEEEISALTDKYAPPDGGLLLARDGGGQAVGCVAFRPLGAGICEMKRLYVTPKARGCGLGRCLVAAAIEAATKIGYSEMRLDTLASMEGAQALYRELGFMPMEAYYETPIAGTVFMRLSLKAGISPS